MYDPKLSDTISIGFASDVCWLTVINKPYSVCLHLVCVSACAREEVLTRLIILHLALSSVEGVGILGKLLRGTCHMQMRKEPWH